MIQLDGLALREQDKYRRFRDLKREPHGSPGLTLAPIAWDLMGSPSWGSLTDFGCGECAAVDWFRAKGLDVLGVDLVATRPDVVETCLWSMGAEVPIRDYGFSADVLEHLPETKVPEAMARIREKTRGITVIQVATRADRSGRLIGETLHLTVRQPAWWHSQFAEHWGDVQIIETANDWQWIFRLEPGR